MTTGNHLKCCEVRFRGGRDVLFARVQEMTGNSGCPVDRPAVNALSPHGYIASFGARRSLGT